MPFVLIGLSVLHVLLLHQCGSSNPLGVASGRDMLRLYPYFAVKDLVGLCWMLACLCFIVAYASEVLGHSDNAIEANPLVTPLHIVPEWYFLPMYAILRSIPHKLAGVVAMLASILVLLVLPWLHVRTVRSSRFLPVSRAVSLTVACCWVLLAWIGGMPVEAPYVVVGQLASLYYFAYFVLLHPLVDALESSLCASDSDM